MVKFGRRQRFALGLSGEEGENGGNARVMSIASMMIALEKYQVLVAACK